MKVFIYILCCLLSLCICFYMTYGTIIKCFNEPLNIRLFIRILACIGWGYITYEIIQRKYKWVQKLCN